MSMKDWEKKVLAEPGAADRVATIEDELRLAAGLTALREQAGLSQRELARRLGVTQPRVAAIERSRNITIEVLEQYVDAVGGDKSDDWTGWYEVNIPIADTRFEDHQERLKKKQTTTKAGSRKKRKRR